jgi:hypothetical protein
MEAIKPPSWWMWFTLTGFMGAIIFTLVSIGIASQGSTKNGDMIKAILTTATVNGVLCMMIAGMGYFSVAQTPMFKQPYIFLMLHLIVILSIIGTCVSSLRQLGVDPTSVTPPPAASTTTTAPPTDLLQVALGLGSTGFALGVISIGVLIYMSRKTQT